MPHRIGTRTFPVVVIAFALMCTPVGADTKLEIHVEQVPLPIPPDVLRIMTVPTGEGFGPEPTLEFTLNGGSIADPSHPQHAAPFSLKLGMTVGPSFMSRSTVATVIYEVKGLLSVSFGAEHEEWTISQANYRSMFGQALYQADRGRLLFHVPVKLTHAESDGPGTTRARGADRFVHAIMLLVCVMRDDQVVVDGLHFPVSLTGHLAGSLPVDQLLPRSLLEAIGREPVVSKKTPFTDWDCCAKEAPGAKCTCQMNCDCSGGCNTCYGGACGSYCGELDCNGC